jgi:hypothetical protein
LVLLFYKITNDCDSSPSRIPKLVLGVVLSDSLSLLTRVGGANEAFMSFFVGLWEII